MDSRFRGNDIKGVGMKLAGYLEPQLIQRLYSEQEGLKEKIEIGDVGDIIRSRWSWRTSEELRTLVFDTDGYFDMGNIRPASVETGMLSVGAKSTQFILKEVQIEGNYTGDKSKFYAGAGELIHLSIAEEIRTWTLSENTQDSLVDGTAYYIYAKCTKEAAYTGQIVVDEAQRKFDDDPIYYYFLIGVLHSVVEGVRGVSLTYGQTIINGKFIRTGKIESTNGLVYFDLDNNTLMLPDGSITAGKIAADAIETDKIKAGAVIAGKISVDSLAAIEAVLGTVHAGTIYGTRFRVGGGTNEDIYFEDSGIRLFDSGSGIVFKKDTSEFFRIFYTPLNVWIITDKDNINFSTPTKSFTLFGTGALGLPPITDAPSGYQGLFAYNSSDDRPTFHNVSAWRHYLGVAGW